MKITAKQKTCVASAVAVGIMVTQGYLLYDKHNHTLNLEEELTSKMNIIKSLETDNENKDLKINELDSTIKDFTSKIEELQKSNTQKDSAIKKLESEKANLNNQIKDLKKTSAYPTSVVSNASSSVSRGENTRQGVPVTMTLTFYGDGADENGGYAGLNAYNQKLTAGTVASNVYPRGTKFKLPNGQILTVNDKGGPDFNSSNRLDVFVPRLSGESDNSYKKRISNYGRKTLTVYKITG